MTIDDFPVDERWLKEHGAYDIPLWGEGRKGLALKVPYQCGNLLLAFYPNRLGMSQGISEWAIVSSSNDHIWLPTTGKLHPHERRIACRQVRDIVRCVTGRELERAGVTP